MLGEEIGVRRTLDGLLRIEGVVENAERRTAILSALAAVKDQPLVKLQIETPEEAERRLEQSRQRSDAISIQVQEAAPLSNAALRQELSPVFNVEPLADGAHIGIADEPGLARATLRLNELAAGADDAVRSAFTLSSGGAPAVKSPQFRLALSGAESLAQEIENASQRLKSAINIERR
jgi:hypothetical protein